MTKLRPIEVVPSRIGEFRVLGDGRRRRSALVPTGGFLAGYTHTLNPVVGCLYGRTFCGQYCYAQHQFPARLAASALDAKWGEYVVVKDGLVEALRADLQRATRREPEHRFHVRRLAIYLASSTEPCAGPALAITRDCLRVLADYPIARLVLQTRSPAVLRLRPELEALGDRLILSFTLESDHDAPWAGRSPGLLPTIAARRRAFERLAEAGALRLCATVSPCVHLAEPAGFADWIAARAELAVVDTFLAGDGGCGARTARTRAPALLADRGVDWASEEQARGLLDLLVARLGPGRVFWSKAGFAALARPGSAPLGELGGPPDAG